MQPWGGTTTVASTLDHHAMGFWYDTDPPDVQLTTPSISFADVPQGIGGAGRTTYRAIVFEVRSCAPVTLEIVAGPSGGFATTLLGTSVVVPAAHGNLPSIGRLWIAYTSTNPGDVANGSVTVAHVGTSDQWIVSLTANTIARPKSAVVMALDRSGSMSMDAGDGTTKNVKLKEAVEVFVDTMLEGDGLGLVSYDDVIDRLFDVTDVGPQPAVPGSGRAQAAAVLSGTGLDPRGLTAIGASLVEAQDAVNDAQAVASPPYDKLAIVVLTDGIETAQPWISSIIGTITTPTYAVGLGLPNGISAVALDQLAQSTGKYLLVTGALTQDQRFRLSKFFLQILAGISGAQIVVDPTGDLVFGPTHRIPFAVASADHGIDAILTSPFVQAIDFQLEAPDGTIIDPGMLSGIGEFVLRRHVGYYRLPLPFGGPGKGIHAGRWHALLSLSKDRIAKLLRDDARRDEILRELRRGSVPYNFLAHSYSTLNFEASCQRGTVRPGEAALVSASLDEYGVPVEKRADAWIDVTAPNGTVRMVKMNEVDAGVFTADVKTHMAGLYGLRCRARGTSLSGAPFTREAALSLIATAGDVTRPSGEEGGGRSDDAGGQLLDLLECVLKHAKGDICGMNPDDLRKCIQSARRPPRRPRAKERAHMKPKQEVAVQPPIASLVEPEPPPRPPVQRHHRPGEPMFGLSPEDLEIGEERRARNIREEEKSKASKGKKKPPRRHPSHGGTP